MLRMILPITLLLAIGAAAPAIAPGNAQAAGHPACLPGDVVDNDDVRIWFHGAKFQLQLFKKNVSTGSVDGMYQYKSMEISEVASDNTTLATLKLENAEPQSSTCTVEEQGEWVNVTYTSSETVRATDDGSAFVGEATVELVYHFNKTDSSAKFDLNVQDWPWQGDDSELSYGFDVASEWLIEPAENGLGFRDADTGEPEAFVEWALNATASYDDGHDETAIVESTTTGSAHATSTSLQFTNVTAGYSELDYDPRIAAGPYVIVANILIPLADLPEILERVVRQLV